MKIFVDLDGVLADFDSAYLKANGGSWPEDRDNDDIFWEPVLRTPDFWLNIQPMPDARILWQFLLATGMPLEILSSPGTHDTYRAIQQKQQWFRNHFCKQTPMTFKLSKQKRELAEPFAILIDDWGSNIKGWEAEGGIAVHHKDALSTIEKLKDVLRPKVSA